MEKQGGRRGTAMDPRGILEGMPGVNDNCGNNSPPVGPGLHSLRGPAEPLLWGTAAASDGGVFHAGREPARNHDHLTDSSPRSAGRCYYYLHLADKGPGSHRQEPGEQDTSPRSMMVEP